jgi:hypothetical protein
MLKWPYDAVLSSEDILEIAQDDRMIFSFYRVFGCLPYISDVEIWATFPGDRGVYASQDFHRDRDCFCQLKRFIYLNDVGSAGGPHQFISGSHSSDSIPADKRHQLADLFEGNGRHVSMERFLENVPGSTLRTLVGKQGTGVLENTFALHRGLPVTDGHRILLSITYTALPLRLSLPAYLADLRQISPSTRNRIASTSNNLWYFFRTKFS